MTKQLNEIDIFYNGLFFICLLLILLNKITQNSMFKAMNSKIVT